MEGHFDSLCSEMLLEGLPKLDNLSIENGERDSSPDDLDKGPDLRRGYLAAAADTAPVPVHIAFLAVPALESNCPEDIVALVANKVAREVVSCRNELHVGAEGRVRPELAANGLI